MTLQEECRLSYYEEVGQLSQNHNVFLVRHQETQQLFVRKVLSAYNLEIYHYLKDHPIDNTPMIYDLIEDEGRLIVIEEYILGETLQQVLQKHGNPPEEWMCGIMRQVCRIVEELHSVRPPIIHRDIKPSNIIITQEHAVKLLDLNAAHQIHFQKAEDTVLMGTKGYAAPEQYGFGQSDVRTDVYALGKLMEQMGANQSGYSHIVKKATQIEPKKRYRGIEEMERALDIQYKTPLVVLYFFIMILLLIFIVLVFLHVS